MCTLIIGGGLSGLALADALEAEGRDYVLVEARDRVGGRILTEFHGGGYFDLGPAWFWQGQPRIAALIDRLGLEKFEQYAQGDVMSEDAQGQVRRGRGFASMGGAWRLRGGLGAMTQALADRVPNDRLRMQANVTALTKTDTAIIATLDDGGSLVADQVVLAMPPRLAAKINFTPALPACALAAMQGVQTWMAGQAKALAVYHKPFWRDAGLSGNVTSRFGPMVEIHDASPATGGPYGLFGFIGVPPQGRADDAILRRHLIAQFERVFGRQAAHPAKLYVKDWAHDRYTATRSDMNPLYAHPDYGMPAALSGLWDSRLHFAGTEVATQFGGYLEGALQASYHVLSTLKE